MFIAGYVYIIGEVQPSPSPPLTVQEILSNMKEHPGDVQIHCDGFDAIIKITSDSTVKVPSDVMVDVIQYAKSPISTCDDEPDVVRRTYDVLISVVTNNQYTDIVIDEDLYYSVMDAMEHYDDDPGVQRSACAALFSLLSNDDVIMRINVIESGALGWICEAMNSYIRDAVLQGYVEHWHTQHLAVSLDHQSSLR